MLNVVDVSRYQAGIHQEVLAAAGAHAVITGVTFGGCGVNPYADAELQDTLVAGLLRGAYHIRAWGNWTPEQEADWFLQNVGPYLDGRTILVLDWEECDTSDEDWALRWLQHVEARTGIKPWFYVNLADLNRYGYARIAANGNALWLAAYPYASVTGFVGAAWQAPAVPAGHTLAAWQYVGTGGALNGVAGLDLSAAYIDAAGWTAYATPGASAQATAITPLEDLVPNANDEVFKDIDGNACSLQDYLLSLDSQLKQLGGLQDLDGNPCRLQDYLLSLDSQLKAIGTFKAIDGSTVALADQLRSLDAKITSVNPYVHDVAGAAVAQVLAKIAPASTVDPEVVRKAVADAIAATTLPAPVLDTAAIARAVNDDADARERTRLAAA